MAQSLSLVIKIVKEKALYLSTGPSKNQNARRNYLASSLTASAAPSAAFSAPSADLAASSADLAASSADLAASTAPSTAASAAGAAASVAALAASGSASVAAAAASVAAAAASVAASAAFFGDLFYRVSGLFSPLGNSRSSLASCRHDAICISHQVVSFCS